MILLLFVMTTAGMFLVQVTIYQSMPPYLKGIVANSPIVGVVVNFALSGTILVFTGIGAIAGISNLIASVGLGFYLLLYKRIHQVSVNLEWRGWSLLRYPALVVQENAQPSGLLDVLF